MSDAIEIANLKYRYHDGTVALAGVSLRVAAGECVGLLGPNGSGKSTLLLHLNGILPDKPGRVRSALAQVGLAGFGRRATHHLSHGEKRRLCLAGVLACDPEILVLDEPTSDLDPRGRREFKALLRQIPATKLMATHDLELVVEMCSRVVVLDRGAVVADGPTRELLNNEELMLAHGLERPHMLRHAHPH